MTCYKQLFIESLAAALALMAKDDMLSIGIEKFKYGEDFTLLAKPTNSEPLHPKHKVPFSSGWVESYSFIIVCRRDCLG